MTIQVRDYDPKDIRDAERIAAMFNDFDSAWPGGFTRGEKETAETVRKRLADSRRIAVLVAEDVDSGDFVGYCDLDAQPGQRETAYVDLLGARLSVHGKGVGKALIREAVRRTSEHGYREVTLHTWGGNTKAVPLYKKTGFQWVPDSDVYMRNFVPAVLAMPIVQKFIGAEDWYALHDRDLTVAPDDVTWRGMKVYEYRFRKGDQRLHLVFQADSAGLTSIETPDFSLSCSIPVEEACAGETYPVVWEIESRCNKSTGATLVAHGDAGLEIELHETIAPGQSGRIVRDMRVSADTSPKRRGERLHLIRSTIVIDGQAVSLETGVKVVRPIEIEYAGQGVLAGREESAVVRLRSRLTFPVAGVLSLDAHPSVRCETNALPFEIPAGSWTQCRFALRATEPGVHRMNLRYEAHNREASGEDGRARLGCRPITLRSFAGGDVQCSIDHDDEEAILESADTRLEVNLRGGYTLLNTGGEFGQELAGNVQLGPPFGGTRVKPPLFTAEALTAGGVKRLSITSPPNPTDGLSITRTFSLAAGGVVRIDHRLTNRSGAATRAKLRMRAETKYRGHVAAPLSEGTVREPMFSQHEYPASDTDLLASGARLAENWIAAEQDGRVAGLVWEGDAEQERNWSLLPMLTFDSGEAPPYGAVDLPAVWWITGRGDWRMVREWWKRLCAPSDLEERSDPEPVRILEAEVEPSPILLRADAATVRLALVSRRGMAIKGSLTAASDRFRVETAALTFADVSRAAPFRTDMRLETADQRFAGTIAATVDTGVLRDELKLPAVHLGTGDTVQRSEPGPGRICIDNGYMTLRFANGFFGALQSLEVQGVEQLRSAWPEAVPMVWMNPWFGGVHPYTEWMGSPRLARETVTCEPVEREGERGWLWHGARLTCEPRHRDRRWLRAEVEYLTLPGSNVVALCVRCTNLTDARMVEKLGVAVWAQPGGAHSGSVIHWERDGEHRVRRRGGFNADGTSTCWAAIANPDTTDALVLVSSESSHAVEWEDLETEGAHLQAGGRIVLQPRESREWLVWLVHTREVSQAASYGAALSRARRLP